MIDDEVKKLKARAELAAKVHALDLRTPEARAGFAAGVRALASLMSACANVAEQMRKENDDDAVDIMLMGYATSLRMIIKEAESLIPLDCEY